MTQQLYRQGWTPKISSVVSLQAQSVYFTQSSDIYARKCQITLKLYLILSRKIKIFTPNLLGFLSRHLPTWKALFPEILYLFEEVWNSPSPNSHSTIDQRSYVKINFRGFKNTITHLLIAYLKTINNESRVIQGDIEVFFNWDFIKIYIN